MKKIILFLFSALLCLSICACSNNSDEANSTPSRSETKQTLVVERIDITWNGKTKSYTNGSNMTIDDFGQISKIKQLYKDYSFEYKNDGFIEKINIINEDPEKTGYETFSYENGNPNYCEYNPNDGFRSQRKSTIATETDGSERIISITENNTYTDADDGNISYDTTKYEYEYDVNNNITAIKYHKDNKLDHTTEITYDANGNITKYSNIGVSNNSTYLSVQFSYKSVDESSVKIKDTDSFTAIYNFEMILKHIL